MAQSLARYSGRLLLTTSAIGGAGAAYHAHNDEGFNRSLYFWRKAFPVYCHYRAKQIYMENLNWPEEEQDKEYEKLHEKYAIELFDIVLQLKGFYIKLAQTGSTRADFLPKQYLDLCVQLQDDAPSKPVEEIIEIIEKSYGKSFHEIFQSIDPKPLGVASIGQAHRAVLKNGQEVAIKVQHPDAERYFRWDISTIKDFCSKFQQAHLPYLKEVEKQFMTEFNYMEEGRNLDIIRSNIQKSPYKNTVTLPKPYLDLCTKEVLVMEFLRGKKLLDGIKDHLECIAQDKNTTVEALMEDQRKKDQERQRQGLDIESGPSAKEMQLYAISVTARRFLRKLKQFSYDYTLGFVAPIDWPKENDHKLLNIPAILKLIMDVHGYEIFVNGAFNGDPHPGNILLLDDGRLGLIDYGQVKHISKEHRLNLAKLTLALAEGNKQDILRVLTQDMGIRSKKMDPYVLEKQARLMFDKDDRSVTEGMNIQLFVEHLTK
jgi:aarF domain-containing kinase